MPSAAHCWGAFELNILILDSKPLVCLTQSVSVLQTSAQQALTGTINSSMQAVHAAQATLDDFETLPPLGQDAVSTGC